MGLRLTKVEIDNKEKKVVRKCESMGNGLLLVRLDIEPRTQSSFHWLLENKRKPPFDIAINPQNGLISYLKFFLQDEKVKEQGCTMQCGKYQVEGLPLFDLQEFNEKNYQIFEEGQLDAFYDGRNLCITTPDFVGYRCLNLDEKNAILFDEKSFFVGVILKNLSEEEIGELMQANVFGTELDG
ncbi:MAG TPA: hypothetical protein PKA10_00005 [Selenomonadales bacterium]|nr:hypothetical protein [Selenomonadales bacterium]